MDAKRRGSAAPGSPITNANNNNYSFPVYGGKNGNQGDSVKMSASPLVGEGM